MNGAQIQRRGFLAMAGTAVAGAGGLLAGAHAQAADGPRLTVGPIRRVGADGAKYFEPWIAANPRDASNLVVVGSHRLDEMFHREPAAWFTMDGGATWSAGELAGTDRLRGEKASFADAFATYAPDGTAFCEFLGGPNGNPNDLWIYRSDDGGRRWQGPATVPGFLDYPRLVADLHDSKPRLFVAANGPGDGPFFGKSKKPGYGCVVLRSDDGARSFSAVNLLAPSTLLHTPIESPLILPDGRLLIGFVDFPDMPVEKKPQAHITHGRIYTATSRDGGTTFSLPAPVRDTRLQDGYGDGFVALAVDRSDGPRKGRLYALTYNRSDRPPGLQLQTSQDAVDWTPPAAVPGLRKGPCPLAAIAVSSRGVLGLSWIQGSPGDLVRPFDKAWTAREHARDLYFTASADGGTTFAAPVPVLKTPSWTDPKMGFGFMAATISPWPHLSTALSTRSGSTLARARRRSRRRGSRSSRRAEPACGFGPPVVIADSEVGREIKDDFRPAPSPRGRYRPVSWRRCWHSRTWRRG
jgi:hypothetical protein